MFALQWDMTDTEAWRDQALCRDGSAALTELFFSEQLDDIARAKRFCGPCPVRDECLAAAIEAHEPWGVWGGELILNGRVVANKRPRGRPPKVPRPEPALDELVPRFRVAVGA